MYVNILGWMYVTWMELSYFHVFEPWRGVKHFGVLEGLEFLLHAQVWWFKLICTSLTTFFGILNDSSITKETITSILMHGFYIHFIKEICLHTPLIHIQMYIKATINASPIYYIWHNYIGVTFYLMLISILYSYPAVSTWDWCLFALWDISSWKVP